MNNNEQPQPAKRNIWNLILGIGFTGYGTYRLYYHINRVDQDTFGLILSILFIVLGIYDLYKYFTRK